MDRLQQLIQEALKNRPGLWANIHAKRERGEKPARKGSKAYKSAVAAGKEINKLNEIVTATQVICDNCGWKWDIADGGDDLYICHKCNHDNTPEKWWAILVNSPEDWEILSKFLDNKGYKFESGYTISGNKLSTFNPFKDEKYFDSHEYDAESDDMGYNAHMSYTGKDEFILLNRPKNKLNMVNLSTFIPRKNSTYKRYNYFTNLMDLIKYINS